MKTTLKNLVVAVVLTLACFCTTFIEDIVIPPQAPASPDYSLMFKLAERFQRPFEEMYQIVQFAHKASDAVFPTALDILAVVGVESSFNPEAEHRIGPSVGLMQINLKVHDMPDAWAIEANMAKGVALLKEYRALGSSNTYAFLAYNSGPGSAKRQCKKRCSSTYTQKIAKLKKELQAMTTSRKV